jgi:hypothetical protein
MQYVQLTKQREPVRKRRSNNDWRIASGGSGSVFMFDDTYCLLMHQELDAFNVVADFFYQCTWNEKRISDIVEFWAKTDRTFRSVFARIFAIRHIC